MMLPLGNSLRNSYGRSAYNLTNRDDAKYVGYMYGGANGVASTSRLQATTNETDTRIKSYLDEWYEINISGTNYEDYISDTLFCNDRQLRSEVGGAATGTGFGTSATYYASTYRLVTTKTPSLKCNDLNDRFTTKNYNNAIVPGNNALEYPIGLLTADEGVLAGLKYNTNNNSNYLFASEYFWTMSPWRYSGSNGLGADVWYVGLFSSFFFDSVSDVCGVRGVINLKPNTPITGTGTTLDPYVVQ